MQSAFARQGVDAGGSSAASGVADATRDAGSGSDDEDSGEHAAGSARDRTPGYPTQDQSEEALGPSAAAAGEEGAAFAGGARDAISIAAAHGEHADGDGAHRVDGDGNGADRVDGDGGGDAADDKQTFLDFLAGHLPDATAKDKVAELREERKVLNDKRKRVTMDMRNETKKKTRRMQNSAKLSTMDLVRVLEDRKLRAEAKAAAKCKAKAKAKAST